MLVAICSVGTNASTSVTHTTDEELQENLLFIKHGDGTLSYNSGAIDTRLWRVGVTN